MDAINKAVEHLRSAKKVMVLSGAGMSTAAGIPGKLMVLHLPYLVRR